MFKQLWNSTLWLWQTKNIIDRICCHWRHLNYNKTPFWTFFYWLWHINSSRFKHLLQSRLSPGVLQKYRAWPVAGKTPTGRNLERDQSQQVTLLLKGSRVKEVIRQDRDLPLCLCHPGRMCRIASGISEALLEAASYIRPQTWPLCFHNRRRGTCTPSLK